MLHLVSRPDAWERWFTANGLPPVEVHGMLIDQFAVATQAAIAGMGITLLPEFLFQHEFMNGDLVPALDAPMRSVEAYYLASPTARAAYPPLQRFRDWLLAETEAYRLES